MATHDARRAAAPARAAAAAADKPILAAKITAPAVPDWAIPRPRITKLIDQGTRWRPLTVVTGPPGAGKTMALALWAAAASGAVAWVSLDGFDNRPEVFWSYVVAALRRSGVAMPETLPAAAQERAAGHGSLLRLASALAAHDPPVTLVIDDLHVLTDQPVLDGLDFVLRNVGPGLRLVVAARMDPLLPLHRYRLAGELAEIRAGDLAFTTAEAGQLMAQHGCALPADSLESLTRRTEGWVAGLRLAAISMSAHPDPDQFVRELITDDSALTGYLVEEVLNAQPPEARELLLSTSILDQVSAEAASELTGDDQAGAILPGLAHANAFVQPAGAGRYRYHTLFAEVLRLKLRREHPARVAALHRRAARWYARDGSLTTAVHHAAQAGDWQLAAGLVVDGLAISEIIEPCAGRSLADEFGSLPRGQAWTGPQPYLICAAVEESDGQHESAIAALDAAEGMLAGLPAAEQAASRLAGELIRLTAARRTGNLAATAAAAARAEIHLSNVSRDELARHPALRLRVLTGRGAAELWSGHLDEAARVLESGIGCVASPGAEQERAECLGHLALVEAFRGRLRRAAGLAAQATTAGTAGGQRAPSLPPHAAALTALAWVHLQHNELREARGRLQQGAAALRLAPDMLMAALADLIAASTSLAEARTEVAAQLLARARSQSPLPAWLQRQLTLTESRVYAAAGQSRAAVAAAGRAGPAASPEVAVTLAHAWLAAGDRENARRALAPALAGHGGTPEQVRLQAMLVDAELGYDCGDRAQGRRSLVSALRLAQRERLRLPFVTGRGWIEPLLPRDPELGRAYQRLFPSAGQHPAPRARCGVPAPAITPVEPLSEREREVLRHLSHMLDTAEVASEMYISVNTVKTHLKNIYRKLAATRRGEAVRRARQLQLI